MSPGGPYLAPAAITSAAAISIDSTLGAVAVSVVCALLVGWVVLMLLRLRRGSTVRRVAVYMTPTVPASDPRSLAERALGDRQARTIARVPFLARLRLEMDVADLKLSLDQLIIATVLGTVLIGWLLELSTGSLLAALLALSVPFLAHAGVKLAAGRQRREFSDQLPDNLQVIASAMRAGQTFAGAMRSAVDDAPEPSQRELRRAVVDESLGVPLTEALGRVTERMKSEDFQHVAIVASLQRETGGNTAEVIDLVAETVRERIEIRRMVRSLTAQGRLSGGVLSLLPVGLLIMISLINPSYVHPLFHATAGLIGLGIAIGLVIVGGLIIRRIVNIDV
jgi:tight adherence protein B